VIGIDGSPSSEEAVRTVASRAWPNGSEVRLVTVIDPWRHTQKDLSSDASKEDYWVGPFIEAAEKRLRAADLRVSRKVEVGDPKLVLVADADEWGADCIVIGAAASPSTPSTLGGVSTAVVARAHCSVEIIRTSKKV
jgi:nucleotide-binding universal stress UspA family protein